jgi:hypothetical protein
MKKKFTTIALMLATLATTATLGSVAWNNDAVASADTTAETYAISDIFYSANSGVIGSETVGENKTTAFTLKNEQEVTIKRSLALKWYEESATTAGEGVVKYFTMQFASKDKNFDKLTFSIDTPSAWATEEDKKTNSITLEKKQDDTYAVV